MSMFRRCTILPVLLLVCSMSLPARAEQNKNSKISTGTEKAGTQSQPSATQSPAGGTQLPPATPNSQSAATSQNSGLQPQQPIPGQQFSQAKQFLQGGTAPGETSLSKILGTAKTLINELVQVKVDPTGKGDVHVKAPFVNVDVKDGQSGVRVNAPFVHVEKNDGSPASVTAPFVNMGNTTSGATQSQPGTSSNDNAQQTK